MNNLYFACIDCKIYTDAGYRWAYWTLEHAGIVRKGESISVNALLSAEEYWNSPADETSDWYYKEIFPTVKLFLQEHREHQIIYGEKDDFLFDGNEDNYFDWLEIGFLASLLPRTLVEILGFKTWDEASEYISKQERQPGWWGYTDERNQARAKFEKIVRAKNGC